MIETFVNEAARDTLPPYPVIRDSALNFVQNGRIIGDDSRLASDLKLAMAVQRHMLPRNTKRLATIRCAGASVAAAGIGGDYYDFLDLGSSSLGFVLADVSGKGVAAALLAANLQATIR